MERSDAFIPYDALQFSPDESTQRASAFRQLMERRRSVREFSDRPVPRELIEDLLMTASSAPSGAHKQPWTFCAVSDPALKRQIREAAEREEYENYHSRMSEDWLADLAPFGTNWQKPFLETVPWLIIVFKQAHGWTEAGEKQKHYYVNESVGLATGFLLAAIHNAGLVSLTHTPSPMNFLAELLNRPANERPFLLIPVGYPAEDAQVPVLRRKAPGEAIVWHTAGE